VIFLDTNVLSETHKRVPDEAVVAWLKRYDIELAIPTVAIAEIAFGIEKTRADHRSERLEIGLANCAPDTPTGSSD
jgi:predicted nucleic acid-binding protein